ncbi:MAG: sulfurtransferase TusA family protein [Planctomycetales bacterium]|nr:sulfurtransferase TusA family protein [Planctomycetales bacterium]
MIDFQLNCEGMNCPMPIVELTKAARLLEAGQRIEVKATDLAFRPDLQAWARRMGHAVESFEEQDAVQVAVVCLGGASQTDAAPQSS